MSTAPPAYGEFGCRSNFSFLSGASHPEEIAVSAHRLGLSAIGLADTNTVAGVVRLHQAAKEASIPFHPGARLEFSDGHPPVLAYPKNRAGWGRLCRMLTTANMRGEKGAPDLRTEDLDQWSEGLLLAMIDQRTKSWDDRAAWLRYLKERAPDCRLVMAPTYDGADRRAFAEAMAIGRRLSVPVMAIADARYHSGSRRPLADVLTAIRLKRPVEQCGWQTEARAESILRTPADMARLFHDHPSAVPETMNFAGELSFSLDELRYQYPDVVIGPDDDPQQALTILAWQGAQDRYGKNIPDRVRHQIDHELALIGELDYARYFLTVWDVIRFARTKDILCQGRGSAANSTVCYCIGITEVDPALTDLLFERFISQDRREPPDIDVDFEHERREEVIQYIYETYGREHAGLAATVITYRARSAAREVGKAMGLSDDAVSAMSGSIWGWSSADLGEREARAAGLAADQATTDHVLRLSSEIIGFPRHLSQHVGGFVITRDRLDEVVPVSRTAMEGRTMIEWDKDDIDALGILKIDILALGMLSALRHGIDLLAEHYGVATSLAEIGPTEEPEVYDMICRADTLGVFQIESRAQMTMLPRLRPRKFYDLVIEVAIVRPGPIQGDMVHPYLRRRMGLEEVTYPSKELEAVLERTRGVPLFQEQAMKIAIVAAGFTPSEADRLRRAMATFRRVGTIHTFQQKMVEGMLAKGYEREFAERCFKQIEGFGEYGFPESHAASFALLVYASCWMKARYPDVFCAAMLNAQPMGFYAPSQLVRDAREHGVTVRPVDINHSDWDCTLEEPSDEDDAALHRRHHEMATTIRGNRAVRLGLRQVKGLRREEMDQLTAARGAGYDSVRDLWLRSGLPAATIARLAEADAFRSLGFDRRAALWAAQALDRSGAAERLPLFDRPDRTRLEREAEMALPPMAPGEHVIHDYRALSLSLKAHPLAFLRDTLRSDRHISAEELEGIATGRRIHIAGLVLVRQRPGSAKGVIFMTLEDETGVANIIVWPKVFERYRPVVLGSRLIGVSGKVQSEANVIHVVADRLEDRTADLGRLSASGHVIETLANADEVRRPGPEEGGHPGGARKRRENDRARAMAGVIGRADHVLHPLPDGSRKATKPTSRLKRLLQEDAEVAEEWERQTRQTRDVLPKGRNFH